MSMLIDLAQDRERRIALRIDCLLLRGPKCSSDIPPS